MTVVDGGTLTAAELVALVESPALTVDAGLDLLDASDSFIADITDDFVVSGSSVEHDTGRTIHGTATLSVSRNLVWGSQRLRPYLLLSSGRPGYGFTEAAASDVLTTDDGSSELAEDDGVTLLLTQDAGVGGWVDVPQTFYRWNLGVYLPSTPDTVVGGTSPVWTVDCMDKLDLLATPHGQSHSVDSGAVVTDAIATLLEEAGQTLISIPASTATMPTSVTYLINENWSTLDIVNDLLSTIGYRSLWVDPGGYFTSEPYASPSDVATVWTYSADSDTSTVAEARTITADYYDAPNVITGINNSIEGDIPTSGDGLYTLANQADGLTSIDGRGGRIIRSVISGQYADQAALVTAVTAEMDTAKRVATFVNIMVGPSPVHGHNDVVEYSDLAGRLSGRFAVTRWTLPLDSSDMSITLRAV